MILIICANGGHLTEMREVSAFLPSQLLSWVTYSGKDSEDLDALCFKDRHNRFFKISILFFFAPYILFKKKPSVVLATGGIIAIPFAIFGRIMGIPVVYFECGTRVSQKSLTGRLVYLFANDFFVQSAELSRDYGTKSRFIGSLY